MLDMGYRTGVVRPTHGTNDQAKRPGRLVAEHPDAIHEKELDD